MRTQVLIVGVLLLLAGVGGLVAIFCLRYISEVPAHKYGIVFDAGSSGTRMYLYQWGSAKVASTGLVQQVDSCVVKGGGLSSYTNDPLAAGGSLETCLQQAKEKIPTQQHASTRVYVVATAGLRVLNKTDPGAVTSILCSVRTTLRNSELRFDREEEQARIISGQEEGIASWVTINYATGKLNPHQQGQFSLSSGTKPADTYGVLDLGGGSTQITFVDSSAVTPKDYTASVVLLSNPYKLFTHSFLCYGINEAANIYHAKLISNAFVSSTLPAVILDPCAPLGYIRNYTIGKLTTYCSELYMPENLNKTYTVTFEGSSNVRECEANVSQLLDFTSSCSFPNCSFDGVYLPPDITRVDFKAISGYYYISMDLNLINATQSQTTKAQFYGGMVDVCNSTWSTVSKKKARNPHRQCFMAQYTYTLLTNGYRLGDAEWTRIRFSKAVNGTDYNWALGYMLNLTNSIPSSPDPLYYVNQQIFIAAIAAAAAVVIAGVAACTCAWKKAVKWKVKITSGGAVSPSAWRSPEAVAMDQPLALQWQQQC